MCQIHLWLLAFLAFSPLSDGSQMEVMSAPNLLRVGSIENIFVEIQDCKRTTGVPVEIRVMNHPTKSMVLASTSVTLNNANDFQGLGQITVPFGEFSRDPNIKQYVYLQAQFPDRQLEKVVLVSFQAGYIFIQTDRTLYTPGSMVRFRIFAMRSGMEPVERHDRTLTDAIEIEFETPQGSILPHDVVSIESGIHSGSYRLDETVSNGPWKVVARFYGIPQYSFTAEFEVKEYVPPNFEVELTPVIPYFYVDDQDLTVNIKATYLFGEEVNGIAFAMFGVIKGDQKMNLPNSLQRLSIQRGNGVVTLRREHITQAFPTINNLVGSSIFLGVVVMTDDGGDIVKAESRGIKIVTSPYAINFKKTSKYFTPGMPLDVTVEVLNHDDTPAQGVSVLINPGRHQSLTAANGIIRVAINTLAGSSRMLITADTSDPDPRVRSSSAIMHASRYNSESNHYIHIAVGSSEVELGESLKINCVFNGQARPQNDITYLILSKGQLVKYGKFRATGLNLVTLVIPITKEMLPSFRFIAYYHTNDDEVVSNSVWVDVKDNCMGSLKLEPMRPAPSYRPRRLFPLKITGNPQAIVGLVAVNRGTNKNRLTQKKVWDIIEKSDTGCTPGGGRDAMSVFYDAGLLYESSASGTPQRQDLKCPTRSRRGRATSSDQYHHDNVEYLDLNEIPSSTQFDGSWLWSDFKLPSCPSQSPSCDTTSTVRIVILRDTITSWQFNAISVSKSHGICVAEPLEVIARKDFFIDLKIPYSAVLREQLEIKAILHNYSPDPLTVRVDLLEDPDVCSVAFNHGKYRQLVNIGPQSTLSVPFIIIPMKDGSHSIEVKAAVRDSPLHDGIEKTLLVVPGLRRKHTLVITLDPAKKGVDGQQQEIINSRVLRAFLSPSAHMSSTLISVTGGGGSAEKVMTGNSMDMLMSMPSGIADRNILQMALTVVATMYLDTTNQWETVGFQKRDEALKYIKIGYENELVFRKADGSFAPQNHLPSSSWLTAYVAKVFTVARPLVPVESNVICQAIRFLIVNSQQPNGMFRDTETQLNPQIKGEMLGTESETFTTAFFLLAMQESRNICAPIISDLSTAIDKAVAYLERHLPSFTNPLAVAITSYAMANEKKLNREILYKFASKDLSHWPMPNGHAFTLEATANALFALVKAKAFEDARPVVRWLQQQQRVQGAYSSPQATLMVYRAVAQYWVSANEEDYDLNGDIFIPGRSRPHKLNFNRPNYGSVEKVMTGNSMDMLMSMPSGIADRNILQMALTVVATMYLDTTNQWETVGFQKRDEALKYIKIGYENELVFRKADGSFAPQNHLPSSSWLTAYVAKVFTVARPLVPVESNVICQAIRFLIVNSQQPNGMFRDTETQLNPQIKGEMLATESETFTTAFFLLAMQESRNICAPIISDLSTAIDKAVAYLERHLPSFTNPLAVAITSYAMANEKKLNREILYKFASKDLSHWPMPNGHAFTLEATANALFALVKAKAFEDARPVVRWLQQQQRVQGAYSSPQATLMVYRAVAQYWVSANEEDYDLNGDIFIPGRSRPHKLNFNRPNYGSVEKVMTGNSMDMLMSMPSGIADRNILQMALTVVATMYLDTTNQWETVGFQKRDEALKYIKIGYENELVFRKADGSFAPQNHLPSSSWLTAYVAKVFTVARPLVPVESNVICQAIRFLIVNSQQPNGMFRDTETQLNPQIKGEMLATESETFTTAFFLLAMQESRNICAPIISDLSTAIDKAVAYLERHLPSFTNPLAVAITSYAMANENKLNREILYKFASTDLSHWPMPNGHAFTLEATANALFALVKAKAFEDARPVVRWLQQQQRVQGAYSSPQATLMVYRAVAQYWVSANEEDYDLNVDIFIPGRSRPRKLNFNRRNYHTTRITKFPDINVDVKVVASGTGKAMLKMESMYYTLPQNENRKCLRFDLSVQLLPETFDHDVPTYKLKIGVLHKDNHDSSMIVLEIGLLSGFTINADDLNLLSRQSGRTFSKYEMNRPQSAGGSLIIYLDKVSHTQPEEIVFRIHQTLKLAVLQPAAVTLYENHEKSNCVKFYHPERINGELLKFCANHECKCAEGEPGSSTGPK